MSDICVVKSFRSDTIVLKECTFECTTGFIMKRKRRKPTGKTNRKNNKARQ